MKKTSTSTLAGHGCYLAKLETKITDGTTGAKDNTTDTLVITMDEVSPELIKNELAAQECDVIEKASVQKDEQRQSAMIENIEYEPNVQ